MAQVTFDTLKFVDTLEAAGFPREQARALSDVVCVAQAGADGATKADIAEVRRDITDVRKDMTAQIADVRKDMEALRTDMEAQGKAIRQDMTAQIADVRKDLQLLEHSMTIRLGAMMIGAVTLVAGIVATMVKLL